MIWFVLFIATVIGANWAIETWGVIPIGLGLHAPAGVLFAGLAFSLRDLTHETMGRYWSFAAIAAGACLSWFVSPQFAVASGAAFLFSELMDFGVYAPLRTRHWTGAVIASNVVGLIADSAIFLLLAFGSLDFLLGQAVGKLYMTLAFLPLLLLWRYRRGMAWGWQ